MAKEKLGSLNYQFSKRFKELERFGESKHRAKKEWREACEAAGVKWNPAQAEGIFSFNTYKSYKQTIEEFTSWIKENHLEIKDIEKITRDHAIEYLKGRDADAKSAWTVSKDMAALNKVLETNITKDEAELKERRNADITRSRVERAHDKKYNPENYKEQILVSLATGERRASVLKLKPEQFRRDENGLVTSVFLREKGNKPRYANILKEYQQQVTEIVNSKQEGKPLFEKYTPKIDNHALRAEYAAALYEQLCQEKRDRGEEVLSNYRGYDRKLIREVSNNLGHDRLNVVVESYLRR